jgi:GT2 family glycosyltransferase
MNNDIVVPPKFANNLISFAIDNDLMIVSPARIDGTLDYDFAQFASESQRITKMAIRNESSNAICMCIHWSVFSKIGFFAANPNLLGFEDGLFYNEVRKHKIKHATTGSVWIHHFGSVTQDYMKVILGKSQNDDLVKFNDRKLYGQSWLQRKLYRRNLKQDHRKWREQELNFYKMTLHGARIQNSFVWL